MCKREKIKKRPRKKVILFLVEGKTEIEVLEKPIKEYIHSFHVEGLKACFCNMSRDHYGNSISGGDLTSDVKVYHRNIEEAFNTRVFNDLIKEEGIYAKDIIQIIQLTDSDGCYIPESLIQFNEDAKSYDFTEAVYKEDRILSARCERIRERNKHKRENLDYLSSLDSIKVKTKTIPYHIYYFAVNMDHYVFNESNLEDYKKMLYASKFHDDCSMKDELFKSTMLGDYTTKDMSYEDSWKYLKDGTNSLKRLSNINIMFEELHDLVLSIKQNEEQSYIQQQ